MSSAHPRDASDANQNVNERRQLRRTRQQERRRLMTQEQREATLSRRRTYYQTRRRRVTEAHQHDSTVNPTNVATGTNSIPVRQTCRLDPIPNYVLPSALEHGGTTIIQNIVHQSTISSNNDDGHELNSFVSFNANSANHVQLVNVDATISCTQIQPRLNAQLHRRIQVIAFGWTITVGITAYDFGRLILRIVRKLKKHTAKRIAWIEGWDLTEKGILSRRQLEESTLFRQKIRSMNDTDIQMFYSRYKSRESATTVSAIHQMLESGTKTLHHI